ncbi:hypothetical protein D3C76_837590 [compost metagenome]
MSSILDDSVSALADLGIAGKSTLPIVVSMACRHLAAYFASRLSVRYLATRKRSGVETRAVELVVAAVMHFDVNGSGLSSIDCSLYGFPNKTGLAGSLISSRSRSS